MNLNGPNHEQLNNPVAFEEVLNFPACLLPKLPLGTVLVVEAAWWKTPVVFLVNKGAVRPKVPDDWPVFDSEEFALIVQGVENERVWTTDMRKWCGHKNKSPAWRVKHGDVMGGVIKSDQPGWTLAQVLKRIEAELFTLLVSKEDKP